MNVGPGVEVLPDGDDGTRRTLERMRDMVLSAIAHPLVRWYGTDIVRGVPPLDRPSQVAAIRAFLATRVTFVPDPLGVEWLTSPPAMLDTISQRYYTVGDCDDVAMLGAALGGSVGLPSRFVVVGFVHPDAPMGHVYTELFDGAQWRELDITRPSQQLLADVVSRSWIIPVIG